MDKSSVAEQANIVFKNHPEVKLAYLFGSVATGNTGPLSDYDFAVYLSSRDARTVFAIKSVLLQELSIALKTDNLDIVVLDTAESPELKYAVITEGLLIMDRDEFRVLVEPRILNEYFDFAMTLRRYNLTTA